ncbi:hypothetical protein B0H11DRAFT_1928028 [Mycena galericulata]|nr:hypothetical protein B0H11DRAFT_1928028 [Mycena galericulata]
MCLLARENTTRSTAITAVNQRAVGMKIFKYDIRWKIPAAQILCDFHAIYQVNPKISLGKIACDTRVIATDTTGCIFCKEHSASLAHPGYTVAAEFFQTRTVDPATEKLLAALSVGDKDSDRDLVKNTFQAFREHFRVFSPVLPHLVVLAGTFESDSAESDYGEKRASTNYPAEHSDW